MFTQFHKSIGLSIVAGLTPVLLAISPVAAATQPTKVSPPVVQAQAQPGTDVNTASAPIGGWVQIPAHATQWYKYSYHYDNSTTGNEPSQALVKLTMDTAGAISFAMWTPGSLRNPVHDPKDTKNGKPDHSNDKIQPVGYGTVVNVGTVHSYLGYSDNHSLENQDSKQLSAATQLPTDDNGNLLNPQVLTWAGGATASDTYYVAVKNNTDTAVHYMLSITGPTVSFK